MWLFVLVGGLCALGLVVLVQWAWQRRLRRREVRRAWDVHRDWLESSREEQGRSP